MFWTILQMNWIFLPDKAILIPYFCEDTKLMKPGFLLVSLAFAFAFSACGRGDDGPRRLDYSVMLDTAGHYLLVNLDMESTPGTVVLNMPRWTPGYYEMMDFPKHLCDFSAQDAAGCAVAWEKEGMNRWKVTVPADGRLNVTYRIFADRRDVASSRVAGKVAFLSPAGVFMHVDGELQQPVSVHFDLPGGWEKISSGLLPVDGTTDTFRADDFDRLYDSPFLLGNHYTSDFEHEGHAYHFAIETPDGLEESGFKEDFCKIVSAATRLMGDVPYDNYCLIHMGAGGGGLEHWNSQACFTDGTYRFADRGRYVSFLAFTAHEYYHLYNVKCIRPAELWPFDYDTEALTPMLWVSEGLTCYYEFRLLRTSGVATPDEALAKLSGYFAGYAPYEGQRHMSLRQSSYDIWLNFMNRDRNGRDVKLDYYLKGPVAGLLMDIDIRRHTGQKKSLDDVMRGLYNRYYKQLRRGFTEEEFWQEVEMAYGGPVPLLRAVVNTTEDIDYDSWLRDAGLYVDKESWAIRRVENPTPEQLAFLEAMEMI